MCQHPPPPGGGGQSLGGGLAPPPPPKGASGQQLVAKGAGLRSPPVNFSILNPPPPRRTRVPLLEGVGGGWSKLLCVLRPLCVDLVQGPEQLFSCASIP